VPKGIFPRSPEHRKAIGDALRGRKRPDVSERLRGVPVVPYERTPEHRKKMSEIKLGIRPKGPSGSTDVAYVGAHYRVYKARGKARDYPCVDCGKQAAEWSHRNGPGFSDDPNDYDPRCGRCHRLFDQR
jgi:hypothetical protein